MNNTSYNLFVNRNRSNETIEEVSVAEEYRKVTEKCEDWLKRQKSKKVSFAVRNSIAKNIVLAPLENFIYTVMKKNAILQLYITKFLSVVAKQKENTQSFILSKLRCFRRKILDSIFIQSFISRFTRQYIQLLPAS